jgi:hypothetical protein
VGKGPDAGGGLRCGRAERMRLERRHEGSKGMGVLRNGQVLECVE